MNVGAELARARTARRFALEDISHRTKVSADRLAAIERNDVDNLPTPSLRGFVSAYAAEVGLDPDELSARYLAQFGNETVFAEFESEFPTSRITSIAPTGPIPPTTTIVTPPAELPPGVDTFHRSEPQLGARESLNDMSVANDFQLRDDISTSIVAVHTAREPMGVPHVARRTPVYYAMLVLLPLVAAIGGFLFARNLNRLPSPTGPVRVVDQQQNAAPVGGGDATNAASGGHVDEAARAGPLDTPNIPSAEPRPGRASGLLNHTPAASRGNARRSDVSGSWQFTNRVQSASHEAFNGLRVDYLLQLQQDGDRVTGSGEKRTEGGRDTADAARTPITVEGTLEGRRLALRFKEQGTERASVGMFVMELEDDGSLRGRFSSDAASSRGTSRATRLDSARE